MMKQNFQLKKIVFRSLLIVLFVILYSCTQEKKEITPKEAYTYANPVVDSYRILHSYFVDTSSPGFKADWNKIKNISRVYKHKDRAVQTPNFDMPYSCNK